MFDRADVTYIYDGSFDGFLCCVFISYREKETPSAILEENTSTGTLFHSKVVVTEPQQARRVRDSIITKLGAQAAELLQRTFFSCLEQKELHMLIFMQLAYQKGPAVVNMLTHPAVDILVRAVKRLDGEVQKYKGFVRFSIHEGLMIAVIMPQNNVLPYLARHFRERFPRESFLIYDKPRHMAVMQHKSQVRYTYNFEFNMPKHSPEELHYQNLWRLFHNTIAIKERENPSCQRNFMPKRYWSELTEMQPFAENTALEGYNLQKLAKNNKK